ncbi:MAG: radical SAM protein [Muribaculaceae bacterium]|nr:radical SAM protein [Muribaculaceae bacterium]
MSYFFEDDSAIVIGNILSVERNQEINIDKIVQITGASKEVLNSFFENLTQLGLLTLNPPSKEFILSYRKSVSELKRQKLSQEKMTIDKLPFKKDDAETSYLRKVGGVTQAMLELTYNCSEKCIHCYNIGATRNDDEISYRGNSEELTFADYKRIIDELYDGGCFKIALSGGDPFSKPFAWDIIRYLHEKGLAFDIYTNAQGLVGKVADMIALYPRLLSISLYADNPLIHDGITRIPGSWNRTVSVINQLGDYGVPMDIKVCIMRSNLKSYRGVSEIARKAGGMALFEASINDSVDGDKCVSTFLRLTPEEYEIIFRDANIGLYVGPEVPEYGKQEHHLGNPMCEGGRAAVCIDPTGNVMPCSAFHLNFGNLKKQSLKEIIETSPSYNRWISSKLSDCTECTSHDYCDYCVLCPGKAYSEHGDWRKPSENSCYIAKIRHKVAMDLKNGKDPLNGKTIDECLNSLPSIKLPKLKRTYQTTKDE